MSQQSRPASLAQQQPGAAWQGGAMTKQQLQAAKALPQVVMRQQAQQLQQPQPARTQPQVVMSQQLQPRTQQQSGAQPQQQGAAAMTTYRQALMKQLSLSRAADAHARPQASAGPPVDQPLHQRMQLQLAHERRAAAGMAEASHSGPALGSHANAHPAQASLLS